MITRKYKLGNVQINVDIGDEVAILTTNNPQVTKQMFEMAIKANKPVFWEARQSAMVESFRGHTAKEIAVMMDKDFATALSEQKKAAEYAGSRKC